MTGLILTWNQTCTAKRQDQEVHYESENSVSGILPNHQPISGVDESLSVSVLHYQLDHNRY